MDVPVPSPPPSQPATALAASGQELAPESSAGSKAARGSIWVLVAYGGSQALRLGGNMILWRLLFPEAFGLMAVVNVFMQGLQMFSDVGIGPSIVQHAEGDAKAYLNTAWTVQAVRGTLLCLVSWLVSVPLARFYGDARLAPLVAVVGMSAAISGLNSTKLFTASRHLALGRLTVIDISSQALGLVTSVVAAWISRDVWALVWGWLVSVGSKLLLSHLALPGIRNRPTWDPVSARILIRFGRWVFLSTMVGFGASQADRLIFGKLVPLQLLGVYSIAATWAGIPTQVIDRIFGAVVFPLLSGMVRAGTHSWESFRRVRKPWIWLSGALSACLIAGGPALIRLLYDERASDACWIIQILAAGGWFMLLEMSNGAVLLATARPDWIAASSGAKLVGMAVLIPAGFHWYGFAGAVGGFAGSEILRYIVSVVGAARGGIRCLPEDLTLSLFVAASSALGFGVARESHVLLAPALSNQRLLAACEGLSVALLVGAVWGGLYVSQERVAKLWRNASVNRA